jgi:DNA (cytosine-5)-methyltransferase 1
VTPYWFVKARRAQNENDDETWKQGGVCTTLNAFDNGGESRATVLVLQSTQPNAAIDDDLSPTLVQAMGKGGGHVPILIIDGTRVDDVRVTDDEIMQTVIQRWGTGGGNVPAIMAAPMQVRRLTPMECERLQGFPDGWTETQSDSQRYRQMGNAVTVNVIESIGQQLGRVSNG